MTKHGKVYCKPATLTLPAAEMKSLDPDPVDTERFASASDYSKGRTLSSHQLGLSCKISLGVTNKG